jgi:hypothetical protein
MKINIPRKGSTEMFSFRAKRSFYIRERYQCVFFLADS